MAFDIERAKFVAEAWAGSRAWLKRVSAAVQRPLEPVIGPLRGPAARLGERIGPYLPLRWVAGSLTRRIIAANLVGLGFLIAGYLYLNQYKEWLIEAKRESLGAQGEIVAGAIAANATVENERIVLDPDRLPEMEGSLAPFRDDGFAALELSIRPEKVVPVVRRLMQNTSNRARIYDRDGKLVFDTNDLLARGRIGEPGTLDPGNVRTRTKNLWTRMTEYLFSSDLPVFKEIDRANGNHYPVVRMAMQGTGAPMLLLNEFGEQIVAYAAPIRRARQVHGVLLLSSEPGDIDEVLAKERNAILKVALLALVATLAASLLLAQTVSGPIRRLSVAAEEVSHNINARKTLPDYSGRADEVGQMAQAFTAMTTSLYRRIEASEKFAADVAHELRNPLTAARSTAESLAYAKTTEQRNQLVDQLIKELKRLNRLITDVSNASRLDAELALQQTEPVDVSKVLTGIVETFRDILSDQSRKVELEVIGPAADGFIVTGHEGRLGQVATNLLDNALSFSPEHGTVLVRLRREGSFVEFAIEDEGPGIEPDKLETIFERFYTYRPTANASRGNNAGLGLSISREIVRAHSGSIWAENRYAPDATPEAHRLGARFVVRLPAAVVRTAGRPANPGQWRA